jgi:hypothetical protein
MLVIIIFIAPVVWFIWDKRKENKLFYTDKNNPFRRKCKKCGSAQSMYKSNIEGCNDVWWEEIYPIGNNPKCQCHKYSDYR